MALTENTLTTPSCARRGALVGVSFDAHVKIHAYNSVCLCFLSAIIVLLAGCSPSLPPFTADLGMERSIMGNVRLPYEALTSYFGYEQASNEPSKTPSDKNAIYLYIWLPSTTIELGVRLFSPTPSFIQPTDNDFVDSRYQASQRRDSKDSVDCRIELERCITSAAIEDTAKPCGQWLALGSSDESSGSEPKPPKKTSLFLVRVTSAKDNPLKVLSRGLYRVGISARDNTRFRGPFLMQIGTPLKLHGLAIARSSLDLQRMVGTDSRANNVP